jgi:2-haloacid dehalogenase
VYCLKDNNIEVSDARVDRVIGSFRELMPFGDAALALRRLKERFAVVALSNGDQWLLEHVAEKQISFDFDRLISVESAGYFKPHPAVYRSAARLLQSDPAELMMVSSHGFDVVGARACGFEAAYVNRYGLPPDESVYKPGIVAKNFADLADQLLDN